MAENLEEVIIENTEELKQLEYSGDKNKPVFSTVRVTKKDFSIFELYRKYKNKKLILDVDFQRNLVWESKQKHELIESILMGLPLPIFYFKQQDNATYVVVDGKQRLSALFEFMNNDYTLKGLKILSFLNEKKYEDLVDNLGIYQSQLEDYQVYSHVILPPTPDKIIFDIFDRVNRGGTQLNKQEIRNALYHGNGLDMINEVTKSQEFETATNIKSNKDSRMKGAYLVTRFLSFHLFFNELLIKDGACYIYDGDIDDLLEMTLTYLNSLSADQLGQYKMLVQNNLKLAYNILGTGAFRKELNKSKPLNMNIFETTMHFMTQIGKMDNVIPNQQIREKLYNVITSEEYLDYIGNSRDDQVKVMGRFGLINMLAAEVCSD